MTIGKFLAPLNGQMGPQPSTKPYVDDIFDPLFNAEVRNYYNTLYGPVTGTLAGYADMWDNALTGKKGILGPGMGILSTFGRSVDKADDFILGGLTEGVNAIGHNVLHTTNEAPQNPLKRIFVDDYDYQGTKLMAAAGNAMSRLAGTTTPLTETDFQSFGDRAAGTVIDLATDPGIMGGQLARLNKGTPVGQMGQILSDYDDVVANVAGNVAFPGGKALIGKGLTRIRDFLGGASSASPKDFITKTSKTPIVDYSLGTVSYSNFDPGTLSSLKKMSDDYTINLNPIEDPELYAIKEDIDKLTNVVNLEDYNKALAEYNTIQVEHLAKKNEAVARIKEAAAKERDDILKSSFEGMRKHEADFKKGTTLGADSNLTVELFDESTDTWTSKKLRDLTEEELKQYVKDNLALSDETDFYGNHLEYGKFYDNLEYTLNEYGLDEAKEMVLNKIYPTARNLSKSNFTFAPNRMGFQSGIAKDSLDVINYHFKEFLRKHPNGLYVTFLKKQLGDDTWVPNDVFNTLVKYGKGKMSTKGVITGQNFQDLLDTLYTRKLDLTEGLSENVIEIADKSHSLIPWIRQNTNILQKTQVGRDLIDLADNLEKDIFDNNLYETATKNMSVESVASYNDDIMSAMGVGGSVPQNVTYSDVISPAKLLNQYMSKTEFTPKDLEAYARDFPKLDLKVSQDYIKNSSQYAEFVKNRQELLTSLQTAKDKNMDPGVISILAQKLKDLKRAPTDLEEMLDKYYIPAKQKYWQEVRGAPYAYDFTQLTPKNIYSASKKVLKAPNIEDYIKVSDSLATFKPEDMAKTITNNFSIQDNIAMDTYKQVFNNFTMNWDLPGDMPPFDIEPYIRNFGTKTEKTLFQQWTAAVQSKIKNKLRTTYGVKHIDTVKHSAQMAEDLQMSGEFDALKISEYITRKDAAEGVTLSGENFLESLWASGGFKEFPVPAKMTKAKADAAAAALKKNVELVNQNGNILKFIDVTGEDKVRRLGVAFDTSNLNIKKDINKIYSLFGKKDLGLQDVILRDKLVTSTAWDSSKLDKLFDEIRQGTEDLATKLGYTKFSPNYISHAMVDNEDVAKEFSAIYKTLDIDSDKLKKLCEALNDQDIASGKLIFGAIPMERSHLGAFSQYRTKSGIDMFQTDLRKIHSSTFTQGMFDNSNVQTFFDLFVSDNFKIQNNFDSVETLKNTLNASEGNLNNLSIVKPRYNNAGKLIGFTKYDKFSDAALEKAFKDGETILVPDSVIGSLDRMCKKDARMSSKVYRFINKYLTVPFKFGTLANPGFLAGNIQDAYFKQAVELSKKYGTDLGEELTNVAFSMRQVTQLNNSFTDIFDNYKQWLKDTDLKTITRSDRPADWYLKTFKKSKNIVDTLSIDQIVGNPEMYKAFKEYLNTHVSAEQQKMANLYLFINNNQTTTIFKNNNRDLENLTELVTDNPYAVPNNIFERVMYGNPSKTKVVKINGTFREVQDKGFNSYGLFLNNPVSNQILKSSNNIENWMRSSTILNDLQHQGYTIEDICDILGTNKVTEKAIRDKFKMSMNEAINTMYAANFDYDNVSKFMNKMSYILPFPTFYLKNLAFWADIFTNKPQLIDNVISTHEGLWAGRDTKDEFTAEAKGRGAVPIGQKNKHLTGIVKQTPYNSMFGAFNAVNNLKEDFAYRTNPILRPVARHLQDPKDIKYRPYNTQQYQKNITQADPQFSELAYMFHQLNPYERFINTGLRTPGKIANNSYQLSDFLPSMFQPDFSKK